jgi:hypothetical protein
VWTGEEFIADGGRLSEESLGEKCGLITGVEWGSSRSTAAVGSTGINSSETDSRAIGDERTRATEDSEELPD